MNIPPGSLPPLNQAAAVSPLGSRVGRNVLANVASRTCEALLILVSMPGLIRGLGADRFGLLMLGQTLTQTLGFLEFGISSGLILLISEAAVRLDRTAVTHAVGSAMVLLGAGAALGTGLVLALARPLAVHVFHVHADLTDDAIRVFLLTAAGFPAFLLLAPLRAVALANYKSYWNNLIVMVATTVRYGGMLAAIHRGGGVVAAAAVLVVAGILELLASASVAASLVGFAAFRPRWDRNYLRKLLRFGTSVSLSTGAATLLTQVDKITVGLFQPIGAVAYYNVPFSIASRIWEIPRTVIAPAAPAFTQLNAAGATGRLARAYLQVSRFVILGAVHGCTLLLLFAEELLRYWVGPEFAVRGTLTLQLLAAGVFLSTIVVTPSVLANSINRPDIPAKVHGALLGLDVVLCLVLVPRYGIVGAAVAWLLIHVVDLAWMVPWVNRASAIADTWPYLRRVLCRPVLLSATVGIATFLLRPWATSLPRTLALGALSQLVFFAAAVLLALDAEDRKSFMEWCDRFRGRRHEAGRGEV